MGVDLVDITAKRAALTPNRIAFEDALTGRTLTYAQLEDRCARAAAVLAARGVGREDRVAILCRNRVEFFEIMFACAKLGAIFVPLNWRSPPLIVFSWRKLRSAAKLDLAKTMKFVCGR